jgi:chromosomal replication initiator protein
MHSRWTSDEESERRAVLDAALTGLRATLSLQTYTTWLAPLAFDRLEAPHVLLRAPSRFHADWVAAHYGGALVAGLSDALEARLGGPVAGPLRVVFELDPSLAEGAPPPAGSSAGSSGAGPDRRSGPASAGSSAGDPLVLEVPLAARTGRASSPPRARVARSGSAPGARRSGELGLPQLGLPAAGRLSGASGFGSPGPGHAVELSDAVLESYALNPRYRFENFVVGPSNQLAHAASVAAGASPGKRYNPLFIYSRVGLGKTHLVNAVGHAVAAERPGTRVFFLSAERFTNEFIWALQNRRIDEFRARFRQGCDVLVIDDIQFLAGREQTQEEFFHTFNALYHADKQIVVTSDRYPQEIGEMQDRLVSRFQWGMVADIQAPELDTRIAILKTKAEQERIHLAEDVALYVAQRVESNVRELEGTLLRLAMRADLTGRPIDLELSRSVLGVSLPGRAERALTVEDIQRATAEYFGLTLRELCGERRHRGVSQPRMIAMWIARERLKLSYPDIGRRFGGKDHTTVMSGHKKIAAILPGDEAMQRAVQAIQRKLGLEG